MYKRQHPDISCRHEDFHVRVAKEKRPEDSARLAVRWRDGEVYWRRLQQFNGKLVEDPNSRQVIAHFYDIFSFPSLACGFKLKYPLQLDLYPEVVSELKLVSSTLRIIVLSRRNLVKQAVSSQNLHRKLTRVDDAANLPPNQVTGNETFEPIKIDLPRAIRYTKLLNAEYEMFQAKARELVSENTSRILHIDYEDLLYEQADTLMRVFTFLDVADHYKVTSNMRKIIPDDLSKAVLNFDELQDAFRGTEFMEMLNETRD